MYICVCVVWPDSLCPVHSRLWPQLQTFSFCPALCSKTLLQIRRMKNIKVTKIFCILKIRCFCLHLTVINTMKPEKVNMMRLHTIILLFGYNYVVILYGFTEKMICISYQCNAKKIASAVICDPFLFQAVLKNISVLL